MTALFFKGTGKINIKEKIYMNNTTEHISLMTTQEVAEYLHCSTHYVTELRRKRAIYGAKIGKKYLYYTQSVYSYVTQFN